MSAIKSLARVQEKHEAEQTRCLEANGWQFSMWRWYWVWRKKTHDADFICMTAEAALTTEQALQSSQESYPCPAAMSATKEQA